MRKPFGCFLLVVAFFALPTFAAAPHPEIGLYRLDDGTMLDIQWLEEISSLIFTRFPSGRLGALRSAGGELVSGPSMGVDEPVAFRAAIDGDALRWTEGESVLRGKRIRFATEEVTFRDGDIVLAGTLTLPHAKPPYPAVVFVHGGAAQTRNFLWLADFFAAHGVAVLAYDKRGSGASTGDWRTAGARDLAADALAGIDLLRARKDIDRKRIGLYGSSNGGWVVPYATSVAPKKIAFVIARSASGLPERRNILYEIETDLLAHGMGDAVPKMKALHERDIALLKDPAPWNEVRDAIEAASKEPWFQYARLPYPMMAMNDANRANLERWLVAARANWIDPADIWTKVHVPLLIQIGSADESVPGEESARILRAAVRGNSKATVKLYRNGTHAIFESSGSRPPDFRSIERYVPAYIADLGAWIDTNIAAK